MTELYLDGHRMDLDIETVVAITLQANDITKPDTIQSSYSNTISLPTTKNNLIALGIPDQITSMTQLPYRMIEAELRQDGVDQFAEAYAQIETVKYGRINVRIVAGSISLFEKLGDKSIRELNLSDLDHIWDFTPVDGYSKSIIGLENGFVYDVYHRGKDVTVGGYDWANLFPSVYFKALLDRLMQEAGYTYHYQESELLERLVVPFTGEYLKYRESYLELHSATVKRVGNLPIPNNTIYGQILFKNIVKDPSSHIDTNGYYITQFRSDVKLKYKLVVDIVPESGITYYPTPVVVYFGKWNDLMNNDEYLDKREVTLDIGTNRIIEGEFLVERAAVGDDLGIYIAPGLQAFYKTTIVVKEGSSKEYILQNRVYEGCQVHLEANLPDIKQKDFFKFATQIINGTVTTDAYRGIINIQSFQKTADNIAIGKTLDWSDKLVLTPEGEPELTFKFGEFAQSNFIKWKQDTTVTEGYGDGVIHVDNHNLELVKDLLEFPFAASEVVNGLTSIPVYKKKEFSDPAEYDKQNVEPRIALRSTGGIICRLTSTLGQESTAERAVSHFVNPDQDIDLDVQNTLLPRFFSSLLGVLDQTKVKKPFLLLNAQDVQGFDQSIPVWIEAYQNYFYVNQIIEFQSEQIPTQVVLVRL